MTICLTGISYIFMTIVCLDDFFLFCRQFFGGVVGRVSRENNNPVVLSLKPEY